MARRVLVGLAAAWVACLDPDGVRVYEARGVVRDVQPEYRQVVIAHEDIPGLMPAMTMNFDVADPALLARLAPGQAIEFELEASATSYRIRAARIVHTVGPGGTELRLAAERAAGPAPDFRLTDQRGAPFALDELRGKAVLIDFIYTRCPGPCPILTGRNVAVQRALAPEIRERSHFVSITLDPAYDTPEVLDAYARARGIDLGHWSFLTGSPAEVEDVARRYHVGSVRTAEGQIEHVVATFLIDPAGRIAQRYLGLDGEPEAIARDLGQLVGSEAVPRAARAEPRG